MLILFLGPSSIGKSMIMDFFRATYEWQMVHIISTRQGRIDDTQKKTVSIEEFESLKKSGEIILCNKHFGNNYAYSKKSFENAIDSSLVYLADFGIENINQLQTYSNIRKIIIIPQSEAELLRFIKSAQRTNRQNEIIENYKEYYCDITKLEEIAPNSLIVENHFNKVGIALYQISSSLSDIIKLREIPTREYRIKLFLRYLGSLPLCSTGLLAYKQITLSLEMVEDSFFGYDYWNPPRTFLDGNRTDRHYIIFPESFHECKNNPTVTLLIALKEIIFISQTGAIEIQLKDNLDTYGERTPFNTRQESVIFSKTDSKGRNVWE